ncbi:MAG: hypothetical protein JXA54_06245, partial [Candidatus Heimdallarchaeota archaeon]|nr:hypothetical protein [Candidatus Heimdallarchaeota archaeon]
MFEYLSWQKDPLLLDPEPLEQNTWLTANDLCTQGKKGQIFSPIGHLNLYSFMLRKTDFVSGERLLQSFPYIVLEEEWCSLLRKQTLLLAERAHYYFHNALTNIPIRNWQKKIIEYLEKQHRLPFPLFRLADDWQDYFLEKQFVQFQSARGEDFQLPLYLTEDLAYLTGVVMGDGHLADYFINIIDSSNEHIKNLAGLLQLHFNSKIEFFEQQNAQAWNVNILGKWIVRFFNFLSGQPINERKYPSLREPLLFQSNDLFRRAFWRGLMDADGSYKSTIGFGTASKRLRKDFSLFLTQNHINHNFYEQEVFGGKTFSLNISGNSREQFATILGSNHPQKRAELETLLKRKVYRFSPRPHTLLHQDSWKGRVLKFDETKQLNGYFNLSSIPNLSLANLGSFLRTQRTAAHYSLVTLSTKFGITPSLLSKYELNKTAIPLSLFLPFLTLYGFSQESFLSNYSQLIYRSGRSLCHFPTKPTFPLLNLLQG